MSEIKVNIKPIKKLPLSLANQIAAGEVVERPASILKELIENSIDAGAKQIRINIENSGFEKLSVSDDGHGIPSSQMELAVCPHATSKIYTFEQLSQINTLGFRGEALASIASISKLQITSRVANEDSAWNLDYSLIKNNINQKIDLLPDNHAVGTTVVANNIFYNTPARKKFLRSERTEYLYIERIIKQLALSSFKTAFSCIHNNKEIFRYQCATKPADKARRILKICGKSFYDNSLYINYHASGMSLMGWVSNKSFTRSNTETQYFYINGRIIKDRVITHAIRSAYKNNLPSGRYIAYVLYLTIESSQVDVNVHPTKHEVRFNNSRLVHDFLSHIVNQAINIDPELDNTAIKSQNFNIKSEVENSYLSNNQITEKESNYISIEQQSTSQSKLGSFIKILDNRFLLTEYDFGIAIIDIKKAQAVLMLNRLTLQYLKNNIELKPLMIPMNIILLKNEIDVLDTFCLELKKIGLEFTVTGPESVLLRSIPVLLKRTNFIFMFKGLVSMIVETNSIIADKIILLMCNPEYINDLDYRNQDAISMLLELSKLRLNEQQLSTCTWWHQFKFDDIENLLNLNHDK